jgi:hypothetical protein
MNNRRDFLKAAALTALSHRRIPGANSRVRVGAIGMGTRGPQLLGFAQKYADIVALSDAYPPRISAVKQAQGIGAREYTDFRQLLDQPDVDAVFIAAPDHWHVAMAMAALDAGKDVYLEKPWPTPSTSATLCWRSRRAPNRWFRPAISSGAGRTSSWRTTW